MAVPFTVTNSGIAWAQGQLTSGVSPDFGYVRMFSNPITPSGATVVGDLTPYAPDLRFDPVNVISRVGGVFVLETVAPSATDAAALPTAGLFSQAGVLLAVASSPTLVQRRGRALRIRWGFTVTPNALTTATWQTSGVAPASETESGIVERATDAEAMAGLDTVRYITPRQLVAMRDALISGAPAALDTLNELAAALGDDSAFHTTVLNRIAAKANSADYPALTAQFQRFTANGTWTKPAGARLVRVEVIGGGAGGGTKTTYGGNAYGGGSGQVNEKWYPASDLGATETVIVGLGGAGATDNSETGGDGGRSSFGAHNTPRGVFADGGKGGRYNAADYRHRFSHGGDMVGRGGQTAGGNSYSSDGGAAGRQRSPNGGNGDSDRLGIGSGGGAALNDSVGGQGLNTLAGSGGNGGTPAGGGGAGGRYQGNGGGGNGGRGEVRVWVF